MWYESYDYSKENNDVLFLEIMSGELGLGHNESQNKPIILMQGIANTSN